MAQVQMINLVGQLPYQVIMQSLLLGMKMRQPALVVVKYIYLASQTVL